MSLAHFEQWRRRRLPCVAAWPCVFLNECVAAWCGESCGDKRERSAEC